MFNDISNKSFVFFNKEYTNRTSNTRYPPFYNGNTLDTTTIDGFKDWKKKFPELSKFFNDSHLFKTPEEANINPLNVYSY